MPNTVSNNQIISATYVALFKRAPDKAGLDIWQAEAAKLQAAGKSGIALAKEMATQFAQHPAFTTIYGGLGDAAFIDAIYVNIGGNAADAAGRALWLAKLTDANAPITRAQLVGEFIHGVLSITPAELAALKAAGTITAAELTDALARQDSLSNKAEVALEFTKALGAGSNLSPGTDPNSLASLQQDPAYLASQAIISGVTEVDATKTAPLNYLTTGAPTLAGVITAFGSGGATIGSFDLTNGTDVASANVFNADLVYTPGGDNRINSLQDEDRLTGTGTDAKLNATLGNANDNGGTLITPKLTNINTVNAAFTGSSGATRVNTLDLQDATGVDAINITRISEGFGATVQNIAQAASQLSIANSQSPNNLVTFSFLGTALAGAADSTTLTVSNVNTGGIRVEQNALVPTQGFETINLVSTGAANVVTVLQAEDLQTLNITGTQDLRLGGSAPTIGAQGVESTRYADGLANVSGSLTKIDASALEGKLDLTLGNESGANLDNTSGVAVQLTVTGGKGDDTIRLVNATVGGTTTNTDRIDGGAGNNTMVIVGSTTIAAAGTVAVPVANVTNIQALEVRTGHDNEAVVAGDVVSVNADAFDKLATIYVRNEGQNDTVGGVTDGVFNSVSEGMTVNLTNLTSVQANAITLAHGTTGNSTIANNLLNLGLKVSTGAADTAKVTIVDGVNNNPVFNANIGATAIERVTLVDSDTESNTVHLNQGAFTQAGSTITLQGGAAGQYMNLDSFNGAAVAANGVLGYGYATDGSAGSSTTVFAAAPAILGVPVAVSTSARDNTVSSVFWGTPGTAVDGTTRHNVENIDASAYLGDAIVRVGDVTRADGVSSMSIKTGVGSDTIIFDAFGSTSAGFTSGDTVAAGAGTDTLVLDGNTATLPGTPRISAQTSEWDNLTGIDVLRFADNNGVAKVGNAAFVANNGGGYFVRIDNDFVSQTDAGNRLTIVNNDGSLFNNTESDAVVDLTGLSRDKLVTFVGANGIGSAGMSSNRIVVGDTSANSGQILNGGDTDVRVSTTPGYVAGNNNVYEVRNTADVSINDLAQTSNFGRIEFVNDQATVQTLTLTLNNTVADALADSSSTATGAAQETLLLRAGGVAGSLAAAALNVDARQMGNGFRVDVQSDQSFGAVDNITLNDNVGGAAGHIVDISDGTGNDVLTFSGAIGNQFAATQTVTVTGTTNVANLVVQNSTGLASVVHNVSWDNGDVIRLVDTTNALTNLTASTSLVMNGSAGDDVINGGIANDVITGGAGADLMTGGAGRDTFVFASRVDTKGGVFAATDTTTANIDKIADFAGNGAAVGDSIQLGLGANAFGAALTFTAATTATVTALTVATAADFATLAAAIQLGSPGVASTGAVARVYDVTVTAGNLAGHYVVVNDSVAGIAATDTFISIAGSAALNAQDFIFA